MALLNVDCIFDIIKTDIADYCRIIDCDFENVVCFYIVLISCMKYT